MASHMSADLSSVPSSGEVYLSSTQNGVSQPVSEGAHNTHAASSSQWSPNSVLTHSSSAMDGPSHNQHHHSESELTSFPNSRLAGHPSKVLPITTSTSPSFKTAISPHIRHHPYNHQREYVRPTLIPSTSSSAPRYHAQRSLEPSVSPYLSDHVLNNPNSTRPRTSDQVFASTTDLAAHYGIPTALPPAPSTAPHRTNPVPQPAEQLLDFHTISKNYINMLAQKSTDSNPPSDVEMSNQTVSPADLQKPVASEFPSDVQDLIDSIVDHSVMESPFGSNFLTSPLTPSLDNFGGSPSETPYDDFLQTPLIIDNNMFASSGFDLNQPLFSDSMYADSTNNEKASESSSQLPNFDSSHLLTFSPSNPTIDVPALDPASLLSHPHSTENTTFSSAEQASKSMALSTSESVPPSSPTLSARRRVNATGTRKNLKPEALVPVDAPTQPRRYVIPSSTSRKEVPTAFARKRARRMGLEGEDELSEQGVQLDPTELQQIESKRRSNTEAARRSRQRKLMYQRELEDKVAGLTTDRDKWKERANMCLSMLRKHGVALTFDD